MYNRKMSGWVLLVLSLSATCLADPDIDADETLTATRSDYTIASEPSETIHTGTLHVPDRGVLSGVSPGVSVIRWEWPDDVQVGHLIATDDTKADGPTPTDNYRRSGAHTFQEIRDLTLVGGAGVNDKPYLKNLGDPTLGDGVHLIGGRQRIVNVKVDDVRGTGVYVDRRPLGSAQGRRSEWDQSESILRDVVVERAFRGVLCGHADIILDGIVVKYIRDDGIVLGAATQAHCLHAYACGRAGVVFRGRSYGSLVQGEFCNRYGIEVKKDAAGSTIESARSFGCPIGLQLDGQATIGAATLGAEETCIAITTFARGSIINAKLEPRKVGVRLNANKVKLTATLWGGTDAVVVDEPISDCRVVIDVGGCRRGLVLNRIGYRNQFIVNVAKGVDTPVVLPEWVSDSNSIIVNGVERIK